MEKESANRKTDSAVTGMKRNPELDVKDLKTFCITVASCVVSISPLIVLDVM